MNSYEEKKEARLELFKKRAKEALKKLESLYDSAQEMAKSIPLGQPIMIGHHSEKRDRNFRNRIQSKFEKGHSESEKADYWENKANAAENNNSISSDDPDALNKLLDKLAKEEQRRQQMKSVNRAWQSFVKNGSKKALYDLGFSDDGIIKMQEQLSKAYSWEKLPFVGWQLSNLGQNIQRIKKRIEELEKRSAAADGPAYAFSKNGCRVIDNVEENRTQIFFPGKPSENIRQDLKRSGFRWSPTSQAWQRHISNAAHYLAEKIISDFIPDAE